MTTSVVIPSYNGHALLVANLPHVIALHADEIVVVDDASTDGSADLISHQFPSIKLIRHTQNTGFPKAVNDGFSATRGDIVFLFNQDVTPQKNLLPCTLPHFKDPQVFAVTFNEQDRSWAELFWKDGILNYKNGSMDNNIHQSAWASGGSAAFRKTYWEKLGGFDPIFSPGYGEDLDLGLRATKAGYKIIWDPNCKVTHHPETTFNKTYPPRKLQHIKDRNNLLVQWRHISRQDIPAHILSLTKRLITHPGYFIPLLLALKRIILQEVSP